MGSRFPTSWHQNTDLRLVSDRRDTVWVHLFQWPASSRTRSVKSAETKCGHPLTLPPLLPHRVFFRSTPTLRCAKYWTRLSREPWVALRIRPLDVTVCLAHFAVVGLYSDLVCRVLTDGWRNSAWLWKGWLWFSSSLLSLPVAGLPGQQPVNTPNCCVRRR